MGLAVTLLSGCPTCGRGSLLAGGKGASSVSNANSIPPEDQLAQRREQMVRTQIEARGVRSERVLRAMREVPRHLFVSPEDVEEAYDDHPLGIGHGQTISQPYVVAAMTEALDPKPGCRVLEVGTGSGYQAAVLGKLCKEVYTIEIVAPLAARAQRVLAALGFAHVHVREGDGYLGWPEKAPFDGILITAATPRIPEPLVAQLREGGRLVAPLDERAGQTLYVYHKREGKLEREELFPVRFVPMTGRVREEGR